MGEQYFQNQSYQEQSTVDKKQQNKIVAENVDKYIQEMYNNIILVYKKVDIQTKVFKSLKETDISVNLLQKQKLCTQNNDQEYTSDYIEQKDDSKIGQNFFIGSNPGLFYSKNSQFDQLSFIIHQQKQQKLVSLGNLISLHPSDKNILSEAIHENSLQISGETILDITTQQNMEIGNMVDQQPLVKQNDIYKKQSQSIIKQSYVYESRLSKHNKYCDITLPNVNKKQKDFIVPVLENQNNHNKSRINNKEYILINDKNLTNFFVTKDMRKYVDKFGNQTKSSRIKDNDSNFSQSSIKESNADMEKVFRRSNFKNLGKTNRQSTASNPNLKLHRFEQYLNDEAKKMNMTNTKFLIKVLPSEKTRKFFNQSVSTFINHNYRPVTCRKEFRKYQQNQMENKQNQSEMFENKNDKTVQKQQLIKNYKANKTIKQSFSCDDIALKNSFKKMSDNSKKNKKINLSELQKQSKSFFIRQNNKPLINLEKFNKEQLLQPLNKKIDLKSKTIETTQFKSIIDQKQSISRITVSTKNHQNKYKNLTEIQIEMIKNNNIKRVINFKKVANAKLNIVTKMGVKITPD